MLPICSGWQVWRLPAQSTHTDSTFYGLLLNHILTELASNSIVYRVARPRRGARLVRSDDRCAIARSAPSCVLGVLTVLDCTAGIVC
jgi:hypothetical protein